MKKRTIKEIKDEIWKYTKEINERLKGYYGSDSEKNAILEKETSKIASGGSKKRKEGTYVSVGFSVKDESKKSKRRFLRKSELEEREKLMKKFLQNDIYTPAGRKKFEEKKQKSFETFKKRYGDVEVSDWQNFYQSLNDIKSALSDFAYESYGNEIADQYAKTSEEIKNRFIDVAAKAQLLTDLKTRKRKAKDSEMLIDQIAQIRKSNDKNVMKLIKKRNATIEKEFKNYESAKRKLMDGREISAKEKQNYEFYRQFEFYGERDDF